MSRIGELVFDKVVSNSLGPEAARFMVILPFFKRIDNRLDKQSPETWAQYGDARLSDAPSEFLKNLLDEKDFKRVASHVRRYRAQTPSDQFEKDVWQVYNLLGLQLKDLATCSQAVREHPQDLELRRKLVESHDHLSVLATMAGAYNADKLAGEIRQLAREYGDDDPNAIYSRLVEGKTFKLGKDTVSAVKNGITNQVVDDANDFVSDLMSEVEQGRISPNRFILRLMEQGRSPQEFLAQLRRDHPETFEKGKCLTGKDMGDFHQVIRDELRQYEDNIRIIAPVCIVNGIAVNGDRFDTTNDDHGPGEGTQHFKGTLGWGGRAQAARRARQNRPLDLD